MAPNLREFTEKRLQELELNAFQAARRGGLERTFIRDILIGRKRTVLGINIEKLAQALDTSAEAITSAIRGDVAPPLASPVERRGPRGDILRANIDIPDFQNLPRDLPVVGTASGAVVPKLGESFSLDPSRVVAHVRRLPAIAAAKRAYAIYVVGESMSPMHQPGDLRIVNPDKPPRLGDSVVIQVRAGEGLPIQAFIKAYGGRVGDSVIAHQLNPKATAQFKASTVISVDKVLTMAELLEP